MQSLPFFDILLWPWRKLDLYYINEEWLRCPKPWKNPSNCITNSNNYSNMPALYEYLRVGSCRRNWHLAIDIWIAWPHVVACHFTLQYNCTTGYELATTGHVMFLYTMYITQYHTASSNTGSRDHYLKCGNVDSTPIRTIHCESRGCVLWLSQIVEPSTYFSVLSCGATSRSSAGAVSAPGALCAS